MIKYQVKFSDGDILRDENGHTEFSKRRADYYASRLMQYDNVKVVKVEEN
jgi:hypothetical protein